MEADGLDSVFPDGRFGQIEGEEVGGERKECHVRSGSGEYWDSITDEANHLLEVGFEPVCKGFDSLCLGHLREGLSEDIVTRLAGIAD